MNTQSAPTLNIQEMPKVLAKYRGRIFTSMMVGMILAGGMAHVIPKKFKSHFVLTVYSKYFQSPLIGDFVPGFSESSDMTSQRESLIRQVLTEDYLDYLGNKYNLYDSRKKSASLISRLSDYFSPSVNPDSKLSDEREDLRARIEIFPINTTTFKIGFVNSDAAVAYRVTSDIHAEVIRSLLELRMHTLANIRDAVRRQLGFLPVPTIPVPVVSAPSVPGGAEMLEEDLTDVRNQIRALTAQYTEEHPLVIQLRDRERILISRLDSLRSSEGYSPHRDNPQKVETSGEGARDTYSDLTKKLNYLNIAIDSDNQHQADYFATLEPPLYPSSPLWPKKGLFVLWGATLGLFGSLFIALLREYFERSTLHASGLAHQLGLPLLGELPAFHP